MKGIISLGLLCLFFVCSVNSTGSNAKNYLHSLSRAAEQCTVKCTSESGSNPDSKNWLVEIDVGIYIVYNYDEKYFGIYNAKLQIVIIFELIENSRTMIMVNIKTGGSILINIDTQLALFIEGKGAIDFSTDIYAGFEIVFKILVEYKAQVQGNHDSKSGYYFNISIIYSGNLDIAFEGRDKLCGLIKTDFNEYFVYIETSVKSNVVNVNMGIAILFAPVINLNQNSSQFIEGIFGIISFTVTYPNVSDSFMEIFASVIIKGDVNSISRLQTFISVIGKFYPDLDAALAAYRSGIVITVNQITTTVGGQKITISFYNLNGMYYLEMSNGKSVVVILFTVNVFAIYNQQLNLMFVYFYKDNKMALFSTTTGAGLGLRWKLVGGFTATYIERSEKFVQFFKQSSVDFNAVLAFSETRISNNNSNGDFNFSKFCRSIGNSDALKNLFGSRSKLLSNLEVDFQVLFVYVESCTAKEKQNQFFIIQIAFGYNSSPQIVVPFQNVFKLIIEFKIPAPKLIPCVFNLLKNNTIQNLIKNPAQILPSLRKECKLENGIFGSPK